MTQQEILRKVREENKTSYRTIATMITEETGLSISHNMLWFVEQGENKLSQARLMVIRDHAKTAWLSNMACAMLEALELEAIREG